MEESTLPDTGPGTGTGTGPSDEELAARAGLPDDAPAGLSRASLGGDVSDREEKDALDWLIAGTRRAEKTYPVKITTPEGLQTIYVHMHAVDGTREEEIDAECRDGDGPFARLSTTQFNAALVAEACEWIAGENGKKMRPDSEEFTAGHPGGAAVALQNRFKYEPGIVEALAGRVRELSGRGGDRVGAGTRAMVNSVGNS